MVLTCDPPPSLGNDAADCGGSRDRLRHFRLQSPVEMDSYGCQLYRPFVNDCDVCRPARRACSDGSPTPDFRCNGGPPKTAAAVVDADGGCDVIKTVTSSPTGTGDTAHAQDCAIECFECLAESARTSHSTVDRYGVVGPPATSSRLPRSTVTV